MVPAPEEGAREAPVHQFVFSCIPRRASALSLRFSKDGTHASLDASGLPAVIAAIAASASAAALDSQEIERWLRNEGLGQSILCTPPGKMFRSAGSQLRPTSCTTAKRSSRWASVWACVCVSSFQLMMCPSNFPPL